MSYIAFIMAVECSVICSKNRYYLLDFIANDFYGSKLPSNRDVFGCLC